MQAEKAVRGQHPSTSLRTSEKSTTRLSDSAKLMGTLTHVPENPEESVSVTLQVPGDGTVESLSVRPATKHAVQVFGALSRVGKKLRDSQEATSNKRTQSQAGIPEEGSESRNTSKRQRIDETPATREPGQSNKYDYPGSQPAPQAVPLPAAQSVPQPVSQPVSQPVTRPVAQTVPQPIPQPVAQVMSVPPVIGITPDMQAQIAMAEALHMANSITRFQPERISELFQHLCRTQLWPLLKLEEQRALYLMNLQHFMPVPYGAASVPVAGMAMVIDTPSSSSTTTTTTTMQPVTATPIPVAGSASIQSNAAVRKAPLTSPDSVTRTPAPMPPAVQPEQGSNVSMIQQHLLPDPPNPPSQDYVQGLLDSLPEGTQRLLKKPAEEIRKILGWQKLDLATTNNMTAFTCLLVEIASHGGLPHLDGELDSIVQAFLQRYLTSHRHREPENKPKGQGDTETRKVRIGKDPAYGHLLRLLPKYPQFARQLGIGINNLQPTHRTHLGISRKVNAVLSLMKERRSLPVAQFERRLDKIADDASSSKSSSTATPASATSSIPTSVPAYRAEGGEDEGSDGEI